MRLSVGRFTVFIDLADTQAGQLLGVALPLFSKAEPWGDCLHFEVPLRFGRDRTARLNGRLGDVYLWAEESRILLPFGMTPISHDGEVRLPAPCNVLGTLSDWAVLRGVHPSDKVTLERDGG
ncbi:MAG: cyclophilin-like family protein [Hyphomicrobiaceae bacterium]|nr:cyclophilin-like family protein [Hyphomicrobiaceae bacterium]